MTNKQSVTSRIFQEIGKQRDTLILWSPVMFGAGIITFFCFPELALKTWVGFTLPVLALAVGIWRAALSYNRTGLVSRLVLLMIGSAVLLFALGFGMAKLRFDMVGTNLLAKDLPPVMITGTINKIVILEGGKAKRVVIDAPVIEDARFADVHLTSVRLRSYHFKGDEWKSGDTVRVRAKLMAPSAPVIPGGFDYRFYAYFNGISASGYTLGDAKMVQPDASGRASMQKTRDYIADRAYMGMNGRDDLAGIAVALLTGERAGIRDSDNEAMRISGLAHLIAISGLNIGLVAGIVFFAVRLFFAAIPWVVLRYPIKKWAAVCAIIMAFLYTVLAGLDVPVLRSFIMSAMVFLAIICDRSALNLRFFAFAAFLIMLMTPEAVLGASFQLSFSAVVALILYYQHHGRMLFTGGKGGRNDASLWDRFARRPVFYAVGIVMTTVVSTLATAPFSILHFNTFAVYGVISNMVAIPVTGAIVMPAGLLAVLTIPFGVDHWFWPIMGWGIEVINKVAYWVAALPHANIYVSEFPAISVVLICAGFVWFMLWNGVFRYAGLVALCIGFIVTLTQGHKQVLISEDMRGVLVVDTSVDNSMETKGSPYYLMGHINAYTRRNWLPFFGVSPDVDISNTKDGDNINPATGYCDSFMCSLTLDRVRIGVVFNPLTLYAACENHDVVIARIPVAEKDQCPQAKVIDRFDIYWDGATSITVNGEDYTIRTVNGDKYLPYPFTNTAKKRER